MILKQIFGHFLVRQEVPLVGEEGIVMEQNFIFFLVAFIHMMVQHGLLLRAPSPV